MKITLSPAEWKIIGLLWLEAPRTITQLTAALKADTGWTKNTVITYLSRMEAKGAVRHEEGVKAKQYYPAVERGETVADETERFLGRVFDGRMGLMVSTMLDNKALTEDEIAELYRILDKASGGRG